MFIQCDPTPKQQLTPFKAIKMTTENTDIAAQHPVQSLNAKVIAAIVLGGILAGFSQPFVWPGDPQAQLLDSSGLSGLLSFFAVVPALVVLRQVKARMAYCVGLLFCWVQLVVVFYWIVVAMHVFGRLPLAVSIAGLALLGVATGGQVALAWWMTHRILKRYQLPLWLIFPMALCGIEYFRNIGLYGGFPWGNLGNSLASVPVCLQAASLFGVYGLVFWVALVNAVLTELIWWRRGDHTFPKWGVLFAVGLSASLMLFGVFRLNAPVEVKKQVKVGLLQGNIEQGIKNKQRQHRHLILDKYQKLQKKAHDADVDLIVWPEASLPGSVGAHYKNYKLFGVPGAEPKIQAPPFSLVGAVLREKDQPSVGDTKGSYHLFNSAVMLDPQLNAVGRFDKSHLVPFGEYVPWPFHQLVRKIVPNVGRFQPGHGQKPIEIKRGDRAVKVGATVCYEGVFPEISRRLVNDGAELLVNMTNDAWYGYSSAPWQHLYMYRLRSVETGRPFVRATNTGITAWIDPHGFLHEPTSLYEDALVVSEIRLHKNKHSLTGLVSGWQRRVYGSWVFFLFGSFIAFPLGGGVQNIAGLFCLTAPLWVSVAYMTLQQGARDENVVVQLLLWVILALLLGVALLGPQAVKRKRLRRALVMTIALGIMGLAVSEWLYGLVWIGTALLWIWSRKIDVE